MHLILASSSPYRRQLLQRLGIAFECESADIDETRLPAEPALKMVQRLAKTKAAKTAQAHPNSIIIGSDQVALLGDEILTKPGNRETARKQLQRQSGEVVNFLTAVALINAETGKLQSAEVITEVKFRHLNAETIERYVDTELPLDCAGSFKSEGLGIALFDRIVSSDPTALIGLPLISVATMLRNEGFNLP